MAAKVNCVHCNKLIPEAAHTCVFCGTKQPVPEIRLTTMLNKMSAEQLGIDPASLGLDPASLGAAPAPAKERSGAVAAAGDEGATVMVAMDAAPTVAVAMDPALIRAAMEPSSTVGVRHDVDSGQVVAEPLAPAPTVMLAMDSAKTVAIDTTLAAPRRPSPSQTEDTLYGLDDAARAAVAHVDGESAVAPAVSPSTEPQAERRPPPRLPSVARVVMALAGAALLGVFALASKLLVTLVGAQLVLAMYYLVGGVLLVAGGLLPLPTKVRAAFAAVVGAVPLFVAAPVGGLSGWRGLAAALVFLLLPGALLLRARATRSVLAPLLIVLAVALVALIYFVPADGVMPMMVILGELKSGSLTYALVGLFFLAPLALVVATLTALGRESAGLGDLWAVLILLTASGAIVIAGLTRNEVSLVHLGVGLLAAGSAAAVGVAQLLDVESPSV